jgi:hypothetical protein
VDGKRHDANGFGDDDPLWCHPEHAAGVRRDGIIVGG